MSTTGFISVVEGIEPAALHELMREISEVENGLRHELCSQVDLVSKIGHHVLESGGKRLRPAFVLLAAKGSGIPFSPDRGRKLAACMEMIHMATLIHDDVIDGAELRRGRKTASAIYGNTESILTGDVLLSKAMAILAADGDLEIIRTVSRAVVELAEGEVSELQSRNDLSLTEDQHFQILSLKTASFTKACCEVGSMIAGAPADYHAALGEFGHHVGLAFQLVDDLLDYRGIEQETGKPRATDFKEGCATLPLIYLLPKLDQEEMEFVRSRFGTPASSADIQTIVEWMHRRGAFEEAESAARHQALLAKQAVQRLGDHSCLTLLEAAADFVVSRKA